jgi:3-oxoacyl-[acyl-carrier-protein] synthase II
MRISVRGIGWIANHEYGCVRTRIRRDRGTAAGFDTVLKNEIFAYPVKNYGRFDSVSKMTCIAVALALKDAGISYAAGRKQDIGIVGTNGAGSLRADIEYFRDYLAGGRKLSRGNLFIYTLPSSPLGEAAIHFGLLGPLLYVAGTGNALVPAIDAAKEMLLSSGAPIMLAGRADEDEAAFLVMDAGSGDHAAAPVELDDCRSVVQTCSSTLELAQRCHLTFAGKG